MESTNNLASCLEACQTSTMGDLDCWFVVTNSSNSDICYLYYTSDKYLADKVENTTVTTGSTIYIKRCGNVAVYGETTTTAAPAATTTTCVSLTATTTSAATTSTTQTIITTTMQHTSTTTAAPTTNVVAQTTEGVQCLRFSNQTITYTASELQVQLKKLKTELTIIKNSTNRHMRTLISVYDGRKSAVNIGVICSIILGIIPILFLIADMPLFYRHIRGRWDEEEDDEGEID
ncbi:spore coat protein SP65-like [Pecten maximus]|uniref:spore coat protein SP65-like n=1 Tax=Pecten maximus TaxID=6579 RepID=UPI00145835AF|nr:spore coat protein SP65-like [Pecten maximus]